MSNTEAAVKKGVEAAFSKSELDDRIAAARTKLIDAGIDVFIVTGPENIFYMTVSDRADS